MYDELKREIDKEFDKEDNYIKIKQKINVRHHYIQFVCVIILLVAFISFYNIVNNKNNKEVIEESTIQSNDISENQQNVNADQKEVDEMNEDSLDIQYPDYYGGMYIDDNGNNVILLCNDDADNRKNICQLLKITESKTEFKTCTYSYQYLMSLQDKISENMINKTMPFIVSSSLREDLNCIEVSVNTKEETKLNQLYHLDIQGGAISIKYSYSNSSEDSQK
jgi:hypothetical protein